MSESNTEIIPNLGIDHPGRIRCKCGYDTFNIIENARETYVQERPTGIATVRLQIFCLKCQEKLMDSITLLIHDPEEPYHVIEHDKECDECKSKKFHLYIWQELMPSEDISVPPHYYKLHQILECNNRNCDWNNHKISIDPINDNTDN